MKEVLYDIPVNDIFSKPCECPVCAMKRKLDIDEVAFAMGPSYMEDDIRLTTDRVGFCAHHLQMMYNFNNRLGLGLILNTHLQNMIREVEARQKKGRKPSEGFFGTKRRRKSRLSGEDDTSPQGLKSASSVTDYAETISHSCFLCDRIKHTFDRYLLTTIRLYEKDMGFRQKFVNCQGFCLEHYGLLYDLASRHLSGQTLEDFTRDLDNVFLDNLKRMQAEVSWFVDKFDYRNTDKSWKTSKDALPRAMTKVSSLLPQEDE